MGGTKGVVLPVQGQRGISLGIPVCETVASEKHTPACARQDQAFRAPSHTCNRSNYLRKCEVVDSPCHSSRSGNGAEPGGRNGLYTFRNLSYISRAPETSSATRAADMRCRQCALQHGSGKETQVVTPTNPRSEPAAPSRNNGRCNSDAMPSSADNGKINKHRANNASPFAR